MEDDQNEAKEMTTERLKSEENLSIVSLSENLDFLIKKCFISTSENLLRDFNKLNQFITETIIDCLENKDFTIFDNKCIEKLIKLANKQNPLKQMESAKILVHLLEHEEISEKIFTSENDKIFTDLINSFLNMLDKFDQLSITTEIGKSLKRIIESIIKKGS